MCSSTWRIRTPPRPAPWGAWPRTALGYRGSCTPITVSRSTSFSGHRGAVRTWPSNAGSAGLTTPLQASGPAGAGGAVRRELIAPERIRTIGVVVAGADEAWAGFPVAGIPVAAPLARRRARLALGLAADATVVGTVGRLTYQKAPEDFLAALRRLGRPGVIGVWIGGGELAGRVADLAAAMPEVSVVLAGERTDVPELLTAFYVFALSSLYEGLPAVGVEAMVCGVPVVATAVNAVADVVVPGETGLLVPPRRPELMAEAIGFLLDSPAAATRMTTAARARLGGRFGEQALD